MPLRQHGLGQSCKKLADRFVDFGMDRERAREQYREEKASWQAGINPREDRRTTGEPTVADVCTAYLASQDDKLSGGELSPLTFREQKATCERIVKAFGRIRSVKTLGLADFAAFRATLSQQNGPTRLSNEIVRVRGVFKFAYESELIESSVRYGRRTGLRNGERPRLAGS